MFSFSIHSSKTEKQYFKFAMSILRRLAENYIVHCYLWKRVTNSRWRCVRAWIM